MDGTVQPISEASRKLQGDATKRFGAKEATMAIQGGYSDADGIKPKSEAPVPGSRGAKRAEAQSVNDELNAKKLN
jgi:hypothetical protein